MTIQRDNGRQTPLAARVPFTYKDLGMDVGPVASVQLDATELPVGAHVISGELVVTTAWAGATTATLALGDATTPTRYLAATSLTAAGRTAVTPTGFVVTTDGKIKAQVVSTGAAATAGEGFIDLIYLVKDRANEAQ